MNYLVYVNGEVVYESATEAEAFSYAYKVWTRGDAIAVVWAH